MNGPISKTSGTSNSKRDGAVTRPVKHVAGELSKYIGTGENAKDSFIWMTITWSFRVGVALSILIFVRSFIIPDEGYDFIESILQIWSVFVPIITLALGYAFGKS